METMMQQFMQGAMFPDRLQQAHQETQLNQQQLEKNQMAMDQQKQMLELMRERAASKGTELADQMDWLAGIAADTGNITAAEKLSTKGATIREKASALRKNAAATGKAEAETHRLPGLEKLDAARARLADARAAHLGKAGASKVLTADRKLAESFIKKDYPNIDDNNSYIYSSQIIDAAKELLANNPAMDKQTAIARAYHKQRATGVFAPFMDAKPKQPRNTQYKLPSGQTLTPGMVVGGYSWTGGDPKDPNSWEKEGDDEGEED